MATIKRRMTVSAADTRIPPSPVSPPGPAVRERRAPLQATRTVGYTTPGFPSPPRWDGRAVIDRAYYASVYVNRAVRILAADVAKLPFRVGATPPANPWDQPDHDRSAPLALRLGPAPGGPNPATSPRQLWAWTVAQYLLCGRFAWEAELAAGGRGPRAGRDVVALWPMPAQYIQPVPSQGGVTYFEKFVYMPDALPRELPAERVVYCWRPSQRDWRDPESVLEAAALPVAVQTMADRYSWAFLRNNAVPTTLVTTPTFADADERRAFRDQFHAEFTGPDAAGRTVFAEYDAETGDAEQPGIQVERIGLTQRDAQLLELRAAMAGDVSIALGVPRSKLGDASARSFSNAAQEDQNYQLDTLLSLALELADHINMTLAPRMGGLVGWFDLSQLPAVRKAAAPAALPPSPAPSMVAGRPPRQPSAAARHTLRPHERAPQPQPAVP